MVVRDRDVLQDLSARAECRVYLSVPTVDEEAWRRLEPGTAHPLQRLRAVRELVDAGIDAGVLMAPIVPGLTSHPHKLERTVKAMADSGARHVGRDGHAPRGGHAGSLHAVSSRASSRSWSIATGTSTRRSTRRRPT